MVYGQKFREQIGPFFISLAEDLSLGSPDTRRKTAGHLALAARARVLVPELSSRARTSFSSRDR